MIKYQNHSHYKLPITTNPLEYGKLIEQIDNKYIIQLNITNVAVITQLGDNNFIKLFRKGELMFEFKDLKISERKFIRTINDQKYTFENNKIITTQITTSSAVNVTIYPIYEDTNAIQTINPFLISLCLLYFIDFSIDSSEYLILSSNIIKLRRTKSKLSNWIN